MTRLLIILTTILLSCGITSDQSNTMTLDEVLTKQRDQYLMTYKLGLKQNWTDKSAVEIMLQITGDQNRHLPEVFQLNRYDLVNINSEGKYDLTEFNLDKDSLLKYHKQIYDINGMKVEITPFVWNGCELTVDLKPNITYESWAKKWIDIDDENKVNPDGFQNVIHNVTYPEEIGGNWTISVDFGTSPIDAFKELMTILSKQGVKKIEVHSRTFAQ